MAFAVIHLTQGKVAIVDNHRYAALNKFSWRAVHAHNNWYAKTTIRRDGVDIDISMHRFIARTPFGMVCHHINGNSLDNREANVKNMSKQEHTMLERNNRIRIKREPGYEPQKL